LEFVTSLWVATAISKLQIDTLALEFRRKPNNTARDEKRGFKKAYCK